MKMRMTRILCTMLMLICAFTALNVSAGATQISDISPRYVGVSDFAADLTISSGGRASCYGYVVPSTGYSVSMTVKLTQDGKAIKTWSDSGTTRFSIDEIYYVTPGHEYSVVATASVKNNRGQQVSTYTTETDSLSY